MEIPYRLKAKTERNEKIINAYVSGLPMKDIALEHNISPQRVAAIVARARKQQNEK